MASPLIGNLEKMLMSGKDNALLRFGLGNAYLGEKQAEEAVAHLQQAVQFDPHYSAAWKLLGKALSLCSRQEEAAVAYRQGIAAAQAKGDKQSEKEMLVFLRRLEKEQSNP